MAAVGVDKQILLFPWKTIGQNHANNAVNVGLVNRVDLGAKRCFLLDTFANYHGFLLNQLQHFQYRPINNKSQFPV